MDVRLVLVEDRHSDIEKLFTRIGKLDKASICKIYGLTDELYNYLVIKDTSWLEKFVYVI